MTDDYQKIPTDVLVQHAKALALETGEVDALVPDDCDDWSIQDMDVHNVGVSEDGVVHVHGTSVGTVSERTAKATRWQPAEYENHEIPVEISIELDMTGHSGLGTAYVHAEAAGSDPRKPPEPDINAHRYDL